MVKMVNFMFVYLTTVKKLPQKCYVWVRNLEKPLIRTFYMQYPIHLLAFRELGHPH